MLKKKRFENWYTELVELHELFLSCYNSPKIEYPYDKIYIMSETRDLINKFPENKRESLFKRFYYPFV